MPNITHTYLWNRRRLEFDNLVGFEVYTQDPTTRYDSGTMFHWDGMVIQYSQRFGFGAIGSNLTQISNDSGPAAKILHGFETAPPASEQSFRMLSKSRSRALFFNSPGSMNSR
jgi:hypothetical protein